MKLKNKIALVTGASRGIGRAIAIALAKEGASVIINYRSNEQSAQGVLKMCNEYSDKNIIIKANISSEKSIQTMIKKVKEKHSTLDIVINNAGVFDEDDNPKNVRVLKNVFENNFLGQAYITKYAIEIMKKGKIINISSIHGRLGHGRPEAIAYSASKAALENYTKNLAKVLAPNILVNAVAPGRVITDMWGSPDSSERKKLGQAHLIKRMILPEEIADSVIFLLKNDAMCGEILTIDGGMSLARLT